MNNLIEAIAGLLLVSFLLFVSCTTDIFNPSVEEMKERAAKLRGYQPPP